VLVATGALALVVFAFVRAPTEGSAAQSPSFEATPKGQHGQLAGPHATAHNPTSTAHKPSTPPSSVRVTAIGDSVLKSAEVALRQVFPFLTVDAVVGRQANEVFDEIEWLQLGNRLGPIVVIEAGANGIVSADELNALLNKLADRRRIVLVNVNVPRVWQNPDNELFTEAAAEHPNVTVADWNSVAQEHPEWLYPDGTHLRPEYAYHYADLVKQAALGPASASK